MVIAPGSFLTKGTILDKIIMGILDLTTPKSKMQKNGVFFAVRVALFWIRGIVSYTSRGQLKECKIMPRAEICTEQTL